MSLSDRFITRPVLTSVCSLVIFLFGCFSIGELPIEFIPNVAYPQIVVTAGYSGGNAEFVEQSLTQQLEEILSDTPGVNYITSQSNAESTSITLHLNPDTSADSASLDVQSRIQKATSNLPEQTQQQGVSISQTTETAISRYLITTTQGQYDSAYLSALAKNQLQKQLQLSYIFISHDMTVIKAISDRIIVLKDGLIVEENTSSNIFNFPKSEYTKKLISSVV